MAEVLPWLNLLLIPACLGIASISSQLATLKATQTSHGARLERLDGLKA